MRSLIFLTFISIIFPIQGEDPPPSEGPAESITSVLPDITADAAVICEALKLPPAELKVDIDGEMDYDDLLRLAVWTGKHKLYLDKKLEFPPEVDWKREVLQKIRLMFIKSCPHKFVPRQFTAIARELFMIYLNSVNGSTDNSHSQAWKSIMPSLDQCLGETKEFDFTSTGFSATGLNMKTTGGEENVLVMPPAETADGTPDIDLIVDTMWWLFSFSFGNCFKITDKPSVWATRYKRLFYRDYLMPLKNRWLNAGTSTDFGTIFGDFQIPIILQNIRVCVTAAYLQNGIADRQLVRSVSVGDPTKGLEHSLNRKLGVAI